jgi:hypothetical protein
VEQETLNRSINKKAHTGWELHCKTRDEAHTRALDKWEAQRETWEALKHARAIQFDKRPGDLAMERCDEHRRKMEILNHLDMAAPVHEREGGTAWEWRMGLRNNWTRYVAVGNVFSELYYVRDELAFADPEHVRRVRHAEDGQSYSSTSGRSVLNSKYLADRRWRLRRRVADLLPGALNDEEVEALEVVGEGAHNVAQREASRRITFEDLEEEIANRSIETWSQIQKCREDARHAEETRAARRAAELEKREIARLAALGPHCVLDAHRLSARLELRPRPVGLAFVGSRRGARCGNRRGLDPGNGGSRVYDAAQHREHGSFLLLDERGRRGHSQRIAALEGAGRRERLVPDRDGGLVTTGRGEKSAVDV